MTKSKPPFIGFQISADDLEKIDALVAKNGCSRSEAARTALRLGAPLALQAHSVDLKRLILLLEYSQAALDVIVHREHADAAPQLEKIVLQRMEDFHAPQ